MATVISGPDREAWIIKLRVSVDSGKTTFHGNIASTEIFTTYNRILLPAKFDKKILKNIGYETTLDNMFQQRVNTGHRTITGVIIADHLQKRLYLCRTLLFLTFDKEARVQMAGIPTATLPWWFEMPVNSLAYLSKELANPMFASYMLTEVGFTVEEKSRFGIKQDPVISVEESPAADELMMLFSRPG